MIRTLAAAIAVAAAAAHAQPFAHTYPEQFSERADMIKALADRIELARPWMQTPSGQAMIEAAGELPPRIRRWRWSTRGFGERTYTMDQYDNVDAEQKKLLDFFGISEFIYYAGWTTDAPFVEFRAFDLAFVGSPLAQPEQLAGARILLVDPGVITPAWTLARLGAHVTVASSSQRFRAIYNAPSDRGPVRNIAGGPDGSVTIVDTNWPAEAPGLAGPFDLIVAVSTLNVGRVDPTPAQSRAAAPPNAIKPLGMSPDQAARRCADALAPGGRIVLYNWGTPARPNNNQTAEGDVRPAIRPDHARAAGLVPAALASDASVFTRMLGNRAGMTNLRRQIDREGITAPQLSAVYAVYDKPAAEN